MNIEQLELKHIREITKEHFEALYKISHILNTTDYQDSLIEDALDWVIKVINAERGVFVKYNHVRNEFSIITARNTKGENINNLSEFSSGILQEIINRKEAILHHDVQGDPQLSQFESIQIRRIKSVIGVPILRDEKVWGVFLADSQLNRKDFTNENLVFLNIFSNLVSLTLHRIEEFEKLKDEKEILLNKLEAVEKIPNMIGESKVMKDLAVIIQKVARTDATVLILGESGTGKDLVAKAIHKLSSRKDKPYLAQFCGSIPDTLLESELFGYKKGAFTGANTDKKGLLEVADKGTFFLDEIADISMALQAKLLRVLENKEIIRLGDTQVKKVDVRIITATNKDLQQLVKEGIFREDLFYRLNVFPIKIPPLRDRRTDIPLLAKDFVKRNSTIDNISIDSSAIKKMEAYHWPGNVRQLINVMQRAMILCDGSRITSDHIIVEDEDSIKDFNGTLKEYEIRLLKERLKQFDGNRTLTAESLDVSVRWVQLKLKEIDE
ncbi:two-component sensor cbrb: intrcellular carbon:nitrogen balance [hydrocarbon metagenome]|uniref:Two-component sensor cbrb: intrcellular carbon:nitrogen balance n=1 Tax=hydrocarbon metagenome TaxID=938273 RepID=A0A0W8FZU4_9ZZZZ